MLTRVLSGCCVDADGECLVARTQIDRRQPSGPDRQRARRGGFTYVCLRSKVGRNLRCHRPEDGETRSQSRHRVKFFAEAKDRRQ
jgi:hypothetical protein